MKTKTNSYGERNIFPLNEHVAVRLEKLQQNEGISFYVKEQQIGLRANELYFKLHKNIVDFVSENIKQTNYDFAYLGRVEQERARRFQRKGMLSIEAVICYRSYGTEFIDLKEPTHLPRLYDALERSSRFCFIYATKDYDYILFQKNY